ncbi:hypothetical protein BdWA1_000637 [Babesia duncani]|uniref:Uncharacterized protein n=1 Tax=Babesia duncani TaxID=323732 RepID=A0AAD9UQ67_9APIC|nr:hypothetical protein BdWA1_000637 [Babesia duncani]
MDPIKVLERLEDEATDSIYMPTTLQYYDGIFNREPLNDTLYSLFVPCTNVPERKNRFKRPRIECTNDMEPSGSMECDLEVLEKACSGFKIPFVSNTTNMKHLNESIDLLRSCLEEFTALTYEENDSNSDAVAKFDSIVDSFLSSLDSANIKEIELENEVNSNSEPFNNIDSLVKYDFEKKVIKEQLRAMVLCCNWILEMGDCTNIALNLQNKPEVIENPDIILKITMEIKECNRNITLYSHVYQILTNALRNKEAVLDKLIYGFMTRINFLKQIINTDKAFEAKMWSKLQMQMNEQPIEDYTKCSEVHADSIGLIRSEMQSRMFAKGVCDRLQKEHEIALQQLSSLNSKHHDIKRHLDNLKKQFKELISSLEISVEDYYKIQDSKLLPPVLYKLLEQMYLFSFSSPMRDVSFSVVKGPSVLLEMSLAIPKDLPMPTQETTNKIFPLVYRFAFEDEQIIISHIPKGLLAFDIGDEIVIDSSIWGLEDFPTTLKLSDHFETALSIAYEHGQYCAWDVYIFESYKSSSKSSLPMNLLPPQLAEIKTMSKYKYLQDDTWKLSNEATSIMVHVKFVPGQLLEFNFTDYQAESTLNVQVESTSLVQLYEDKISFCKGESMESIFQELTPEIIGHFGDEYNLYKCAIAFQSYAHLLDWISQK